MRAVVVSPRVVIILLISLVLVPVLPITGLSRAAAQSDRPPRQVKVVIELDDAPSVRTFSEERTRNTVVSATATARNQLARIEQAQQRLLPSLARMNASVIYRTQRVFNGIAVKVDASRLGDIVQMPGVKAVHPLIPKYVSNATSVPFINAPQIWSSSGLNMHGEGIKVGVIDTGIDYIHTDFGGSGKASDYAANNTTIITDGFFPTAKVVGGFDFVGDAYNGISNDVPAPDPDPMDCFGHGTHVAGTIAGFGVNSDGTTYTGSYGPGLSFPSPAIGPGVAPKASLYALRIFGCTGASDVVDEAIEWAVDPNGDGDFSDHLDVINMSLGSPYGGDFDSTAVASDNASSLGVIVVAAAGNSGDSYYIDGSPSTSTRAISAAATGHTTDTIAGFSSRGPRRGDSFLKPDVAAPGSGIFSAQYHSGTSGTTMSGTSMATPHVAGTMALLRQLHPANSGWTVEQLKALVMNTAHDVRLTTDPTSQVFDPARIGGGRIDVAQAAASQVIAYSDDGSGSVSVSFGQTEVVGTTTATKQIRVFNHGNTSATYNVAYSSVSHVPGVQYSLPDGPTVIVPANSSTVIHVQLDATASQMKHVSDATITIGGGRQFISDESGYVVLTANSAQTLRVPVYAVVRPASSMHSTQTELSFGGGNNATLNLTGQDVLTGSNFPTDTESLVSAFELQQSLSADSTILGLTQSADLKYIGATSNFASAGSLANTNIDFGIATQLDWSSPDEVRVAIFIDTNRDGTDDFVLSNISSVGTGGDFFNATLKNLSTNATVTYPLNGIPSTQFDTALFNSNVMVLPVKASDLGLTVGNSKFNYRVETYSSDFDDSTKIRVSNTLTYDAANPGMSFSSSVAGTSTSFDQNGDTISLTFNSTAYAAANSQGVLLLHHFNAKGNRADVVLVDNGIPAILNLNPSSSVVPGTNFNLTVNGSSFVANSVVRWNGSDRTTTFVSSSQLTAAIMQSDVSAMGTASVTVFNPGTGLTSNAMSFAIEAQSPAIASLVPSLVGKGTNDFTLTIKGSGFSAGSIVVFNGNNRIGRLVDDNTIEVRVLSSDVANPGNASVVVSNTLLGGGLSNSQNLTISTIAYGDVNGDGSITISDLVVLANIIAGNVHGSFPAADVLQDGSITISDLVTLANFLAGNIHTLPVQP